MDRQQKKAERDRRTKKKRKSTTKFIMFLMMAITVVVVAFSLLITWVTMDVSVLVVLVPCVFVETATCTGFYFWKRKVENMIDLKLEYGEAFIEETLNDA